VGGGMVMECVGGNAASIFGGKGTSGLLLGGGGAVSTIWAEGEKPPSRPAADGAGSWGGEAVGCGGVVVSACEMLDIIE
jgi:hypothetical protein